MNLLIIVYESVNILITVYDSSNHCA
jgi:hypothetical protein